MTERELARIVRAALDESAERLPAPIAHRLAAARAAALARAERGDRRRTHEAPRARALPRTERPRPQAPRLAWRIAAIVVPISLVAGGLFGISVWESQQRAEDLAELDAAMLVDEVPIAAYADRGFGVFLRNVSWEESRQ